MPAIEARERDEEEREGVTLMSNEVPRGRYLIARAVIVITSQGRF